MRPVMSARASAWDWETRLSRGTKNRNAASIKDKPRDKRQGQPATEITDHRNQGEKVDRHIHQDVAEDEANIPQCQRSLHDLGSHTAGEFILIKIHALVKHQAMEIPSQPHRKIAAQHLVLEEVLQSHQ